MVLHGRMGLGDASFHHGLTLHGALGNTGQCPSLAIAIAGPSLAIAIAGPSLAIAIAGPSLAIAIAGPSLAIAVVGPIYVVCCHSLCSSLGVSEAAIRYTNERGCKGSANWIPPLMPNSLEAAALCSMSPFHACAPAIPDSRQHPRGCHRPVAWSCATWHRPWSCATWRRPWPCATWHRPWPCATWRRPWPCATWRRP